MTLKYFNTTGILSKRIGTDAGPLNVEFGQHPGKKMGVRVGVGSRYASEIDSIPDRLIMEVHLKFREVRAPVEGRASWAGETLELIARRNADPVHALVAVQANATENPDEAAKQMAANEWVVTRVNKGVRETLKPSASYSITDWPGQWVLESDAIRYFGQQVVKEQRVTHPRTSPQEVVAPGAAR